MGDTPSSNPTGTEDPVPSKFSGTDNSTLGDGNTPNETTGNGDDALPHRYTIPSTDGNTNAATGGADSASRNDSAANKLTEPSSATADTSTNSMSDALTTGAAEDGSKRPEIGSGAWFQTADPSAKNTSADAHRASSSQPDTSSSSAAVGAGRQSSDRSDALNAGTTSDDNKTAAADEKKRGELGQAAAEPTSSSQSTEPTGSQSTQSSSKDNAGMSTDTPKQAKSMENPGAIPVAGGQKLGTSAGEERKQAQAEGRDVDAELADPGTSGGEDGMSRRLSDVLQYAESGGGTAILPITAKDGRQWSPASVLSGSSSATASQWLRC